MPDEISAAEFRRALASFTTGITVIAVESVEGIHAMTASAFMSGSLSPPLVVICVSRRSRIHELLLTTASFGVSVLDEKQQAISSHFANQAPAEELPTFDLEWGAPVLNRALTRLVATHEGHHDCGDHTLFVGRVRHVAYEEGRPLVHFGGRYHRIPEARAATA